MVMYPGMGSGTGRKGTGWGSEFENKKGTERDGDTNRRDAEVRRDAQYLTYKKFRNEKVDFFIWGRGRDPNLSRPGTLGTGV